MKNIKPEEIEKNYPSDSLLGSSPRLKAFVTLGGYVTGAAIISSLLASVASEFQTIVWTGWLLYALLALSLTFVWGQAGIFSFGQAAFFGIGGYAYGIAGINLINITGETFSSLIIAVIIAAAAAAILGYFMFYGKVRDVYVAIITLATTLVLLTFMSSTAGPEYKIGQALIGGYNGLIGVPALSLGTPKIGSIPISIGGNFVLFAILSVAVVFGLQMLVRGPFGKTVAALRENELRTQLLGFDIRLHKLIVFAIGGAIAGLAGAGYAAWAMFINPVVFGLPQASLVVIWVLVGGRTSFIGAFVGVFLVENLSSALGGGGGGATPIILGGVLIAVVLVLPKGLVPTLSEGAIRILPWARKKVYSLPEPTDQSGEFIARNRPEIRENITLEASSLSKSFGKLAAVDNVSLSFESKGVHCLVGPNGAGKSTFFNLLIGRHRPNSGSVSFADNNVTNAESYRRARLGLGIKLQIASIYKALDTLDNLWLAAYSKCRNSSLATQRAVDALYWLGLLPQARDPAGSLSHGQQQWLEIAMVLVTEPVVILLDEPTAGMTREETARTAKLVKELGEHASVIVVEHDMEFVRQLDVPITLFHQGEVFAQGSLDQLQQDERVLDIYLGREA